ncbi:MAG TPA: tail fiber domain-containing protein [Verrucomicrobiae bacterium]
MRISTFVGMLLLSTFISKIQAQSTTFTYQGRVQDNGTNFAGTGQFKFALVTSNNLSFTTYWSNDGTSTNGSQPANAVSVVVNGGLFTVTLGDTNLQNMTAIPAAIFTSQSNLQLLIWFNDGVNGFADLMPAQSVTSAPYAAFATSAGSVSGLVLQPNGTNGSVTVISGSPENSVAPGVVGATISGGGTTNYYSYVFGINSVNGDFGAVGGGYGNTAGVYATVGGGVYNKATNYSATVAGGLNNFATGTYATVSGGIANAATNDSSTVAGGAFNDSPGDNATVSGGIQNEASGDAATVVGGYFNVASGSAATVAGGQHNIAGGENSFAAGQYAEALNDGSFVWADDSTFNPFSSTANNQFAVRAVGGVLLEANVGIGGGGGDYRQLSLGGGNSTGFLYGSYAAYGDGIHLGYNFYADSGGAGHVINTGGATSRISTGYGYIGLYVGAVNKAPTTQCLLANSSGVTVNGTFNNQSDRNSKQDFAPISPAVILDKVAQLPITEWSYKEDTATRHVGPVAQDFYSIFNIGTDDKHIAPMDEGGVALAAIQGLDRKAEEKDAQIEKQAMEIEDLKQQVKRLGQMVNTLNQKFDQTRK